MAKKKNRNLLLPAILVLVLFGVLLYSVSNTPAVQSLLGGTPVAKESIVSEEKKEEEGNHQEYNEPVAISNIHVVDIHKEGFSPTTITIGIGDTVAWKNEDTISHRISSGNGKFDTGDLAPGQQMSAVSYSEPGTYTYSSITKPSMKGTIIVAK